MSKNYIKVFASLGLCSLILFVLAFSPNISVNAEKDEFVKEITLYKTWTKINKEPIKVDLGIVIDGFSGGG